MSPFEKRLLKEAANREAQVESKRPRIAQTDVRNIPGLHACVAWVTVSHLVSQFVFSVNILQIVDSFSPMSGLTQSGHLTPPPPPPHSKVFVSC